jgi:hypothetical protein
MSISSNPAENKPFKLFTIYLKTVLFIAAESSYLRITKPPKKCETVLGKIWSEIESDFNEFSSSFA